MRSTVMDIQLQNGILLLTFARVGVNRFGLDEARYLRDVLQRPPNYLGICLTNSGRVFCAGGDVKAFAMTPDRRDGLRANAEIRATLAKLKSVKVPKFAAVKGDCFGGGLELLAAFDRVAAAPECLFGFWQRRQGLLTGWGGGAAWSEKIGLRTMRQKLADAATFSAYEAKAMGLVDAISPADELVPNGMAWIERQCSLPIAPRVALQSWNARSETRWFNKLWFSPEHRTQLKKWRRSNQD